jgi:UDP-N-acetylglucosamine transferase subunit ALG13
LRKPLIIMPRRADLCEHRNDHQCATANRMRNLPNVYVANDEPQLHELLCRDRLETTKHTADFAASPTLLRRIRRFVGADAQARSLKSQYPRP